MEEEGPADVIILPTKGGDGNETDKEEEDEESVVGVVVIPTF